LIGLIKKGNYVAVISFLRFSIAVKLGFKAGTNFKKRVPYAASLVQRGFLKKFASLKIRIFIIVNPAS
jgi:hypothetical protein